MKKHYKDLNLKKSFTVNFSPSGSLCCTLSRDVHLWDINNRKKLWRSNPFPHPSDLEFSPDQSKLAVKSTSGQIALLSTEDGKVIQDFENSAEGEGSNLCFSDCGSYLIDGSWDGLLTVREIQSREIVHQKRYDGEMISEILSTPDSPHILVRHQPKAVSETLPAENNYYTRHQKPFSPEKSQKLSIKLPRIDSSALSEDGQYLALTTGIPQNELLIYSVKHERIFWRDEYQFGGSGCNLSWSKKGNFLASVQKGGVIHYQAKPLKRIKQFPDEYPSDVAYSPDEKLLAIASWEKGVITSLSDH